jgi:branched-chain amino acid aminotransferase
MEEIMAREFVKPRYIWMDGQFIPFDEAVVHVMSPIARYGANVFEGLRVYWNEEKKQLYAFRLREHFQRLFESMKIMRMHIEYSIEDCEEIFVELVRKNEFEEDLHGRHVVYLGGFGPFSAKEPIGMAAMVYPRGRSFDVENGIHCAVSSWARISDNSVPPRIKCGSNYQNSRLAALQAKEDGYDQAILLNADGKVAEGPGACLFMVRRNKVTTPPVTAGILESVTRTTLIELFEKELRVTVQEREIDRTELYVADEVFFCGSGAEITPIVSIDRLAVGQGAPGAVTRQIQKLYFDVVRGNREEYIKWRSQIYD